MPQKYFMDTCIIYAYFNDNDYHHQKVKRFIDDLLTRKQELYISKFVEYEYIILCLKYATLDYILENTAETTLTPEKREEIMEQVKEHLFILKKLYDVKSKSKVLCNDSDIVKIQSIINCIKFSKRNKADYITVKYMGLLDILHLIACNNFHCDVLLTCDNDFKNSKVLKSAFNNSFKVKIV